MNIREIHYVDDDRDDLENFQLAMRQMDAKHTLYTHNDPEKFIQSISNVCKANPLVFIDINMPVRSGFELLRDMRRTLECKKVPVIMISTSDDPQAIMVSKELGADFYMVKPGNITALKNNIKRFVNLDWANFTFSPNEFVVSA